MAIYIVCPKAMDRNMMQPEYVMIGPTRSVLQMGPSSLMQVPDEYYEMQDAATLVDCNSAAAMDEFSNCSASVIEQTIEVDENQSVLIADVRQSHQHHHQQQVQQSEHQQQMQQQPSILDELDADYLNQLKYCDDNFGETDANGVS